MKRLAVALAAVIAAILAYWLWSRNSVIVVADPVPKGSASPASAPPPAHVTKVSPEERRKLAERIAAAQAARSAAGSAVTSGGFHAATPPPSLPVLDARQVDIEHLSTNVMTALKEAIPFLAACYKEHAPPSAKDGLTAVAQMTLTGDPDIGTVIDADQIYDDKHQPLPKDLDECLRNTMQTLAIPPLDEGTMVKVQYSFRFDDDDK